MNEVRAAARAARAAVKVSPERVEALRKEILAKTGQRARRLLNAKRPLGDDLLGRFRFAAKAEFDALALRKQRGVSRRSHHREAQPIGFVVQLNADATASEVEKRLKKGLDAADPRDSLKIKPLGSAGKEKHRLFLVTLGREVEGPSRRGLRRRVGQALSAISVTPNRFPLAPGQLRSGALRMAKGQPYGTKSGKNGDASSPTKDECSCCCCCRCPESPSSSASPPSATTPAHPTFDPLPDDTEWHLKQMRVKDAWALSPPRGGHAKGEGILVAHPDTGWREHKEYDQDRIDFRHALNTYTGQSGKDATRHNVLTIPPFSFDTHGTGTGTIIVSREADPAKTRAADVPPNTTVATTSDVELTGVAPRAAIAPIRCTDTVVLVPNERIIQAIQHAIDIGAHVVSISLGGVCGPALEEVIDEAVLQHNLIVVAAAGHFLDGLSPNRSVIEPAAFNNVIAVAGSTPAARPWLTSHRGSAVDITAPAQGIWYAGYFLEGTPGIYCGEGTSFAAAEVAGIAALWLAFWGVDNLRGRYPRTPLAHVFRQLVRKTAYRPPVWDNDWGPGIVDAYALLREPLPAEDDVVGPNKTEGDLFNIPDWITDPGGAIEDIWGSIVGGMGVAAAFVDAVLDATGISQGLADLQAAGEGAAGDFKVWVDEQVVNAQNGLDQAIDATVDAMEGLAEAGEQAAEDLGQALEDAGETVEEMAEDVGEAVEEDWNAVTGFIGGLVS